MTTTNSRPTDLDIINHLLDLYDAFMRDPHNPDNHRQWSDYADLAVHYGLANNTHEVLGDVQHVAMSCHGYKPAEREALCVLWGVNTPPRPPASQWRTPGEIVEAKASAVQATPVEQFTVEHVAALLDEIEAEDASC